MHERLFVCMVTTVKQHGRKREIACMTAWDACDEIITISDQGRERKKCAMLKVQYQPVTANIANQFRHENSGENLIPIVQTE